MIKLYLPNSSNEAVFVWSAEDIYKLRKQHHIVGALIGVHPYKPNQVKSRHLPLKLIPEEAKLLLEKGIAQLFCSPNEPPEECIIQNFLEMRNQLCSEQVILNKEHRKQEILMKCKDPSIAIEKSEQVKEIPQKDTYFQIFTECPWKKDVVANMSPKFSSTPEDKVKYAVFKDLWEKKFYITCGSKFGGDYLVYAGVLTGGKAVPHGLWNKGGNVISYSGRISPRARIEDTSGDPIICHSLYIVVCVPPSKKIQGLDIVVYGRLGNQVKKTVVLASVGENGEVDYISLQYVPESHKKHFSVK